MWVREEGGGGGGGGGGGREETGTSWEVGWKLQDTTINSIED